MDIKGFTPKKVEKITEDFKRIFGIRALMLFLSKYEITPAESVRIWKSWGHLSIDMIKENPFVLCSESIGVEFERADGIREDLSYPEEFTARIKSGIEYVLKHNTGNGHTCLPLEKVLSAAQGLIDVEHDRIQNELDRMLEEEELHAETFGGRTFLFLPYMYTAETYIAGRISMILNFMPDNGTVWEAEIDTLETVQGLHYASLQREAIAKAMSNGLLVMTGGPGTGKTTTLNAMIELFEQQAYKVAITAPTGRAAKRIAELTGKEAKTIHRLLEVDFSSDTGPKFKRGEKTRWIATL
ncbi:MAG: helix-hairpin-helix domain-containing protein [Oscillospiraceae bacterium]